MITNVPYKPTWVGPAYNPIIWSVQSSKVNSTDFKYVFDIYVNGIKINRIKQRANPNGYGMIDVSTIMQGQLYPSNPVAKANQGETSINWGSGQVYSDNYLMSTNVYLKVGEEYTVGGITQMYTGVADTPGEPAYALYSGNTTQTSIPVTVLCASMEDHEQQWNMQKTSISGIFGGNPFDNNVVYDHGVAQAHPLCYGELQQDLYMFDKMVLSWLNWSPLVAGNENKPIYGFRFEFEGPGGTNEFAYDVPMITAKGFPQRTACSSTVNSTLPPEYAIVNVLASPEDLATAVGYTFLETGSTIRITGYSKTTGSCVFLAPITETVTINVKEYCPDPLYERVRLSWYNTLGGRDYMNFTMFQQKTISTKTDSYAQEQMNWNQATPVPILNDNVIIQNLGLKGGMKSFNKTADTTYKIETDWLTQEGIDLLEGLQKSPQVMAYMHDPNNPLSDYYAYTVSISNAAYTVKNFKQTKMVQGTFDLKFAMTQKIQNL